MIFQYEMQLVVLCPVLFKLSVWIVSVITYCWYNDLISDTQTFDLLILGTLLPSLKAGLRTKRDVNRM